MIGKVKYQREAHQTARNAAGILSFIESNKCYTILFTILEVQVMHCLLF